MNTENPKLSRQNLPQLFTYAGGKPNEIQGKCELVCEKHSVIFVQIFYVLIGDHGTLLRYQTACDLNSIEFINKMDESDDDEVVYIRSF